MKKDRDFWRARQTLINAYVDGHEINYDGITTCVDSGIAFDGPIGDYSIVPKPDPFKELKEAYERGEKIQFFSEMRNEWHDLYNPSWASCYIYRIKPKEDPYKKFKDAVAQGKFIQQYDTMQGKWVTLSTCSFVDIPERYRIKPEPKLAPFTINDAVMFREKWIKRNERTSPDGAPVPTWRLKIDSYSADGIWIGQWVKFDYMLKYYVFEDGTPFGKYVECE